MSIAAIVLAGGASTRMGGEPKALLEYRGETFADRWIRLFSEVCHPVIAVLGYHHQTIANGLQRTGQATLVINPAPERGQLSSLQCALRAIPAGAEGVFFTPVDYTVEGLTVACLIEAYRARRPDQSLAIPTWKGRRGHPVLISPGLASQCLTLPAGASARDLIYRNLNAAALVDVPDAGIVRDIDLPSDYAALLALGRQQ